MCTRRFDWNSMHYFVYHISILLHNRKADLIHFSKGECVAIHSWRQIERVTCQQLIGCLWWYGFFAVDCPQKTLKVIHQLSTPSNLVSKREPVFPFYESCTTRVTVYVSSKSIAGRTFYDLYSTYFSPDVIKKGEETLHDSYWNLHASNWVESGT